MEENKKQFDEAEINETVEDTEQVEKTVDEAETEKENDTASENEKSAEEKPGRGDKKKLKKAEAEIAELKKALEVKENALADMNDKYLRLYAEFDNYRKRTTKEREGDKNDAYSEILTEILPVLDNLERAAQYNTEDSIETPMGKGLALTLKSFTDIMEKLGVKEIEALGKTFDPNLHNAVMHVDDENYGENEIVDVFVKGYIMGDKVIRYSMVRVAN